VKYELHINIEQPPELSKTLNFYETELCSLFIDVFVIHCIY